MHAYMGVGDMEGLPEVLRFVISKALKGLLESSCHGVPSMECYRKGVIGGAAHLSVWERDEYEEV